MRQQRQTEWAFLALVVAQSILMSVYPVLAAHIFIANAQVAIAFFHFWRLELIPMYVIILINTSLLLFTDLPVPSMYVWSQAVLCLVSMLTVFIFPLPNFPRISEKYPSVGCTTMHLNGLDCRIFYPAEKSKVPSRKMSYLHHGTHLGIGLNTFVPHIPAVFFSSLSNGRLEAIANAPLKPADTTNSWPVAVFSHGLGGAVEMYSSLCQYLASEGFVVVALNHTDGSASVYRDPENLTKYRYYDRPPASALENWAGEGYFLRNKQLKNRVSHVQQVLNAVESLNSDRSSDFYGQLNLDQIALVGHSFGGATAFTAAKHDARVKAVVVLDIWMEPLDKLLVREGIQVPVCNIISEHWLKWTTHHETMLKTMYKCSHPQSAFIAIEDSRHNNFCDLPLFSPLLSRLFKASGKIEPTYMLHMTGQLMSVYLRQQFYGGKLFNTMHHQFPEILVLNAKITTTADEE